MHTPNRFVSQTAAVVLALTSLLPGFAAADTPKPNIVVILVDDMGYSDLGVMGSEIQTPHLDRLASKGVLMTHLYTTARCCPSRASLMTGHYSHKVGMGHMDNTRSAFEGYRGTIPETVPMLPQLLRGAGYQTLMVGKWHLGSQRQHWPINRGFEKFYGIPAGGGVYFWPPVGLSRPVYLNDQQVDPAESPNWYSTDAFTDHAIEFIAEATAREKPFFLYAAYIAPHYPLQAFAEDIAKYEGIYGGGHAAIRSSRFERQQALGVLPERSRLSPPTFQEWSAVKNQAQQVRMMQVYASMVDRLDQNIGRLVAALEAQGVLDNTVIFFLSDNGGTAETLNRTPAVEVGSPQSFAAYGRDWANVSNTPYRKDKSHTHEGGTLTPLIAHWPEGLGQPGRITHEPAHIMDLFATALEVAGAGYPEVFADKATEAIPARSLLPQLRGQAASPERPIFLEHQGNQGMRLGEWKLVRSHGDPWELYHLAADPSELDNLAGEFPERVQHLTMVYSEWTSQNGVQPWPLAK